MSEPRHRIIYDTDPGVDDSMAFFLAHASPEIELLALTTIFGNGGIETTTANALRLVEAVGRPDIPVLQGAAKPLLHSYDGHGAMVHGSDGLGIPTCPRPPCSRRTDGPPNSLQSGSWRHRRNHAGGRGAADEPGPGRVP